METRSYKPYIVTILLLLGTIAALAFTVDVDLTDEAGIIVLLPDEAGRWNGEEIRFCQRSGCFRQWTISQLEHPDVCPSCDGEVREGAKAELKLLPPDTKIHKKQYKTEDGVFLNAGIVLSGNDRASIHRPELCLTGQGSTITNSIPYIVEFEQRKPLEVKILELKKTGLTPQGESYTYSTFYAYWFVGKDRETSEHLKRMYYMATDRVFRNVAHRWAYISVSGVQGQFGSKDEYKEAVGELIREIYPPMMKFDAS